MTSRRAFLRGAAALPVAVSTGGTSAVAGAAASAASTGAGLAVALSAAERKARAAIALAKHGGFPLDIIYNLFKTGYAGTDVAEVKKHAAVLLGGQENERCADNYNHGKIDFKREQAVFACLRALPRGVPIRDMISSDMYAETVENTTSNPYLGGVHPTYMRDKVNKSDVEQFLKVFDPYCDEGTTVDDLEKVGMDYFSHLAQRFLDNPKDFADSFYKARHVIDDFRIILRAKLGDGENTLLNDLRNKLEEREKRYLRAEQLLSQRNQKVYIKEDQKKQEAIVQERLEQEAAQIRDAEHRKVTPSSRSRYDVRLTRGQSGEYIVEQQKAGRILRADWLQFVQEIDPQNAKPANIELRAGGMMVAFHSKAIIDHLENLKPSSLGGFIVSLPNRRMGVDLNDPPEFDL